MIAYFTGGGPVQASGLLTTGVVSPVGLSPVTGSNSVTVGGANATVEYVGLTPRFHRPLPGEFHRSTNCQGHLPGGDYDRRSGVQQSGDDDLQLAKAS